MKKTSSFFFVVVLVVVTVCYLGYISGWYEFRRNTDTRKEFLNQTSTSKENYSRDSIEITNELKSLLLRHEDFFDSKEYFEGTNILIDTIVYSPGLDKLAVLIITKNLTSRQLAPEKGENFYYNGTGYLGVREKDTISLSWLGPNFTNSTNKSELSKELREVCFRTFVTEDTGRVYNLNDRRFWTSSVWVQREAVKIKRKEFEEEKLKHPENVYEPPK